MTAVYTAVNQTLPESQSGLTSYIFTLAEDTTRIVILLFDAASRDAAITAITSEACNGALSCNVTDQSTSRRQRSLQQSDELDLLIDRTYEYVPGTPTSDALAAPLGQRCLAAAKDATSAEMNLTLAIKVRLSATVKARASHLPGSRKSPTLPSATSAHPPAEQLRLLCTL